MLGDADKTVGIDGRKYLKNRTWVFFALGSSNKIGHVEWLIAQP